MQCSVLQEYTGALRICSLAYSTTLFSLYCRIILYLFAIFLFAWKSILAKAQCFSEGECCHAGQ